MPPTLPAPGTHPDGLTLPIPESLRRLATDVRTRKVVERKPIVLPAKRPPPPAPAPTYPCPHRGAQVAEIDCGCSGKPKVFACRHAERPDLCLVHAWTRPATHLIYPTGQKERFSRDQLGVCAACPKRPYAALRLAKKGSVIGRGVHRSGWPVAYKALQAWSCSDGLLLDDFIEQNFCYRTTPQIYSEPWAGIFHHPPHPPAFSTPREWLWRVFETRAWQESAAHLKIAFALSEHLATWLRPRLPCPVVTVLHPSEIPAETWQPDKAERRLVQVGAYLRNTRAIHQVDTDWERLRLLPAAPWVAELDLRCQAHWLNAGARETYPGVVSKSHVPPDQFDRLLCTSVVITEVWDASATNVVLDCLVRNTPLVINRHPAVAEYLGTDYPLYFDEIGQVPDLLERANEAHEYLKAQPKEWLSPARFAIQINEAIAGLDRDDNAA